METKRFLITGGGTLAAILLVFSFSFTIEEALGANQNLIAQLPDSPDGAGTPSANIPARPPSSNTTQQLTVPPTIEGARGILEQKKDYTLLAPLNYGNCTQVLQYQTQQDVGEYKTVCTISTSNVGTFFNVAVYSLIGLAALAAVIRIVYGGFLYLGSETFSLKEQGKEAIQNAIWGLIMVLSVYIILNTINPNLLNLNLNLKELMGGQIQFRESPGFTAERAAALQEAGRRAAALQEAEAKALVGGSVDRREVAVPSIPSINLSAVRGENPNDLASRQKEAATRQEYINNCTAAGGRTTINQRSVGEKGIQSIMTCIQK